jgi:hypothetical protein
VAWSPDGRLIAFGGPITDSHGQLRAELDLVRRSSWCPQVHRGRSACITQETFWTRPELYHWFE